MLQRQQAMAQQETPQSQQGSCAAQAADSGGSTSEYKLRLQQMILEQQAAASSATASLAWADADTAAQVAQAGQEHFQQQQQQQVAEHQGLQESWGAPGMTPAQMLMRQQMMNSGSTQMSATDAQLGKSIS